MRDIRIYHPQTAGESELFFLNANASHHIAAVLRMEVGDEFIVFDGQDYEYQVRITGKKGKLVEVMLLTKTHCQRESPLKIHLAQGVAKADRWLYSLQKAVELGVEEITPLWTAHVAYKWNKQVDAKKISQWQGIIISACEQSGRTRIPKLNQVTTFKDLVQQNHQNLCLILDPRAKHRWQDLPKQSLSQALVLIGPEGGFSTEEYQMAVQFGFQGLGLGQRVLRTETAVVSGLTLLQALYGDL